MRLIDDNGNEIANLPAQLRPFARLVKEMRMAQTRYFQTRSDEALKDAKKLEKAIDELIRRVE